MPESFYADEIAHGPAVYTPSASAYISRSPAARAAAAVSEPPRPGVVISPVFVHALEARYYDDGRFLSSSCILPVSAVSPFADSTATAASPLLYPSMTRFAAFIILSAVATGLPPNFWTINKRIATVNHTTNRI